MESRGTDSKKKSLASQRGQGGGLPAQVDASAWQQWRQDLQSDTQQHWTSRDLAYRFKQQTGVGYSASHWHSLLRYQQHMYYYKPQPQDYRKDEGANAQLSERIRATFDALQAMGKEPANIAWGFADEVAAQLHSNNARFWSFEPHLPRKVNTTHGSQRFFGFYALQGCSHLSPLPGGQVADIQKALLEVKQLHSQYQAIVMFWDNATTHKALQTWGWEHQIYFIAVPAYSPDLNPIERIWKSVKKWVNETQFIKEMKELSLLFQKGFDLFKNQLAFTKSWWKRYAENLPWYSPIFDSNTLQ